MTWILALLWLLLNHTAYAFPLVKRAAEDGIMAQTVLVGIAAIIGGLALLLFGFRLFRPTLFIAGFVVFGIIGYTLLVRFEPSAGYASREWVLLLGSLAIGLVGGALALWLFRLGLSCIGIVAGIAVAVFLLGWQSGGTIASDVGRLVLIIACAIVGAIVVHFFEKPAVIVCTSIGGAYLVVLGIDMFAVTGFAQATRAFLSGHAAIYTNNWSVNGMLLFMAALSVIGVIVQYQTTRGFSKFSK